jgi:hypothetical protein
MRLIWSFKSSFDFEYRTQQRTLEIIQTSGKTVTENIMMKPAPQIEAPLHFTASMTVKRKNKMMRHKITAMGTDLDGIMRLLAIYLIKLNNAFKPPQGVGESI